MDPNLRREWTSLGLDGLDFSRLGPREQERVADILARKTEEVLPELRAVITESERRRQETAAETVSGGFGVIIPDDANPDVMAMVISYSVKDIPGICIKRVNQNEIFYGVSEDSMEALRAALAEFDGHDGICIREADLKRPKSLDAQPS